MTILRNNSAKSVIQGIRFDIFLLLCLIFNVVLIEIDKTFSVVDDIICGYFFVKVLLNYIESPIKKSRVINAIILYLLYSFFLVILRKLPFSSVVQIFIASKFIFVFLYFNRKGVHYKLLFYRKIIKVFAYIFCISIVFALFMLISPTSFELSKDDRGINGLVLTGAFFSRTLYSSFLILCLVIFHTLKNSKFLLANFIIKHKVKLTFLTLLLTFLTFTRKDFVFALALTIYFFAVTFKGRLRGLVQMVSLCLILIAPFINDTFFSDINSKTFTENQIRLEILNSGLKVFENYAPFGSGPGTFGSIGSLKYQKVYMEMGISERVYLGYEGQARGPIFDVFIISLLAEYGVGILFYIVILYFILTMKSELALSNYLNIKRFMRIIILYIFVTSFTVPILINSIGLTLFALMGLFTKKLSSRRHE